MIVAPSWAATSKSWVVPIESRSSPCSAASSASRANQRRLSSARTTNGGIVISPLTRTGQRSMKDASSAGGIPAFPSSSATFTWTSTSSTGCCSSRFSTESDATEWIRRTLGATSLILRLWSAPMKSQLKSSRCASCFATKSWARFSPTSSTPASARTGSSSAGTYLIAAQISTSPMRSRTDSRLLRIRAASRPLNCSGTQHQPGLPPRDAGIATVREVQILPAARAAVEVLDLLDAAGAQLVLGDDPQVEHPALGGAVDVLELGAHLVAHLVAAASDPRPHGGRGGLVEHRQRPPDDSAGQAAPAAVEHGHPVAARERHRVAVGHQHEQGEPAPGARMAIDARQLLPRRGERAAGVIPLAYVRSVDLPAHDHRLRPHAHGLSQPPPVLRHPLGLVVGEDPEVQRAVGALAHTAQAGGEERSRAGQLDRVDQPAASSAACSSSSRPETSPSSFRRRASASPRPTAGPSGTPASSRSRPAMSS